jgi:hypothetical protein
MTIIGLFSDWCQQLIGRQVSLAKSYINDAELFITKRASEIIRRLPLRQPNSIGKEASLFLL